MYDSKYPYTTRDPTHKRNILKSLKILEALYYLGGISDIKNVKELVNIDRQNLRSLVHEMEATGHLTTTIGQHCRITLYITEAGNTILKSRRPDFSTHAMKPYLKFYSICTGQHL